MDKTEKIVECVPNFSEGRDPAVIGSITREISRVEGVTLLGVEPDKDYNRCVVTFVGTPGGVTEAAFLATKMASQLIDMRSHKGEHPRLGATDIVPFVPVSGVDTAECVALSKEYGRRVASELGIPVYLYEEAASTPERQNLSNIRKGEYEGLTEKLKDPAWKPDYGDAKFNPKSGATVTGARFFLVAYNVSLDTNDKQIAHEIALRIRESGRTIKDPAGTSTRIPGKLKSVKAMGVHLDRSDIAQVSINLTNYMVTPPHIAFEEVKKEARILGVGVTGSEVVGLIPKEALLMAGRFYSTGGGPAAQASAPNPATEEALIATAVERLGLSSLDPFEPGTKVIEFMIRDNMKTNR